MRSFTAVTSDDSSASGEEIGVQRVGAAAVVLWKSPTSAMGFVRGFPWWIGILAGPVGAFAFSALLARFSLGISAPGDLVATLATFPAIALFFLLFTAVQGIVGRLFGGALKLIPFMATMGWTWLPGVLISIFVSGISWLIPKASGAPEGSFAYLVALLFLFGALFVMAWTVRLQFGAIRETLQLNRARALCVYLLTAIPGFMIFDAIV